MTPAVYPLTIYQGDTYHWQFAVWLDSEKTRPADLKGATAVALLKAGNVTANLDCAITLPNFIAVTMSSTASANLVTSGLWQLTVTHADGDRQTVARGPVNVMAWVNG